MQAVQGKELSELFTDRFYGECNTEEVARKLLGHYLCRHSAEGLVSGIIVETEAYLSENDDACHASRGIGKRNAVMFGPPGKAYVYLIYGCYFCFNVVTGPEGTGEAVLVRAVEPVEGRFLMQRRRGQPTSRSSLADGPGKLCQAFAIDQSFNGHDLQEKPLYLSENRAVNDDMEIIATPRIGVTLAAEKPLRFIIRGNKYLSRREPT